MHSRSAHAAVVSSLVAASGMILGACQAAPSGPSPAASSDPAPKVTSVAAPMGEPPSALTPPGAAPSTPEREALCTRSAECYIEVARKAAIERGGDSAPVDREADKLRARQNKRGLSTSENVRADAVSGCMKLACADLLPCVAKFGKPK